MKQGKGTENNRRGSILDRRVSEDFPEEVVYEQAPEGSENRQLCEDLEKVFQMEGKVSVKGLRLEELRIYQSQ